MCNMPPAIAIVIFAVHYAANFCCEFRHIRTPVHALGSALEV